MLIYHRNKVLSLMGCWPYLNALCARRKISPQSVQNIIALPIAAGEWLAALSLADGLKT
jgi:hypothetical protein